MIFERELSDRDLDLLAAIERKRQIVQETVGLVANGYTNAAFFFGPGGHGKSHAIKQKLDQTLGVDRCLSADQSGIYQRSRQTTGTRRRVSRDASAN